MMMKKANMCILFRDEAVDVVFVDHSVLGAQIKFSERLPRNDQLFEAIGALLKAAEKTPTNVTLCVPRDDVMQRTLRYPVSVREDLGNMIQFEATRHVPLPETDRLLGYTTADSPDEKQVVLDLVAARRSAIQALVDGFEAAGVPVDEAIPFCSLIAPSLSDVATLLVLVDAQQVELCLYGQGMLQDSQLIRRDMPGFSPERVIIAARQVVAKHKTWLGDEGVSRILVGGVDQLPTPFEADLGTAFGLHTHRLELPETMAAAVAEVETPLVEVMLAASLDAVPTLNLIENRNRKVPISKRTILISSLCLLLAVETLSAFTLKTMAPAMQRKKVMHEIEGMKRKTASIQKMKDKNRMFRKQLYRLESVCSSHVSAMEVLRTLSDALPEDTYLRQFSFDGAEIRLKGYSKTPDKVPELVMALPFVNTVSTSDIEKKVDDYHEFSLGVSLRSSSDEANDS